MKKYLLLYEDNKTTYGIDNNYNTDSFKIDLFNYLNLFCLEYGSSINGRIEAYKYHTNSRYKTNLIISHEDEIYYLSLKSLTSSDNVLINYMMLDNYHKVSDNQTILKFKNGQNYIIDFNYRIIKRQKSLMENYLYKYYNH